MGETHFPLRKETTNKLIYTIYKNAYQIDNACFSVLAMIVHILVLLAVTAFTGQYLIVT